MPKTALVMPALVPEPAEPAAADPAPEVLTLLRQIAADLHVLAAGRRPELAAPDRTALARLLPEIARAVGARYEWTARELVRHAIAADAALFAAIESASGPVDSGTARRLGRLLRRGQNVALAGQRVERIGCGQHVAIEFHGDQGDSRRRVVCARGRRRLSARSVLIGPRR
jgi:hypothetical protein